MSVLAVTIIIHHFKFSFLLRSLIIYSHVTAIFFFLLAFLLFCKDFLLGDIY